MQNLGTNRVYYGGVDTLLACLFCFPFSNHIYMVPYRTVAFNFIVVVVLCICIHVHVCIMYEKTKGKFPGEYHVVRIGKTKHASLKGLLEFLAEHMGEGVSCNKSLL